MVGNSVNVTFNSEKKLARFADHLAIARLDHSTKHIFIVPGVAFAYLLRGIHNESPVVQGALVSSAGRAAAILRQQQAQPQIEAAIRVEYLSRRKSGLMDGPRRELTVRRLEELRIARGVAFLLCLVLISIACSAWNIGNEYWAP